MFHSALQTYDQAGKTTDSNRKLEAQALFKAARMLEECQQSWAAADRVSRLDAALRFNQRLWSFFQGELLDPGHSLPVDLRASLLQISGFVDKRILEVLADPTPEKLKAIIDINRHIAAGLASDPV
jgi:flagellar protein FlaF